MGKAPCCDKANVKRGPWSPEEDFKLKAYIEKHGTGGNWIALPQKVGLKRCGKSCRLRWLNYLRPNLKHGGFSEEEDNIICSLCISIGSRWSVIAAQLPGRTDNDIKNYWNTKLKKKLLAKLKDQNCPIVTTAIRTDGEQTKLHGMQGFVPFEASSETNVYGTQTVSGKNIPPLGPLHETVSASSLENAKYQEKHAKVYSSAEIGYSVEFGPSSTVSCGFAEERYQTTWMDALNGDDIEMMNTGGYQFSMELNDL